jgi:hypothetical protein
MPLTMIKQEDNVKFRVQNLQAVDNVFYLYAHMATIQYPLLFAPIYKYFMNGNSVKTGF